MKNHKKRPNLNFRQTRSSRSASKSASAFSLFNRLGSYLKRRV